MIRPAVASDVGRIFEMGARFVASTAYRELLALDRDKTIDTLLGVLESPKGVMLVAAHDERLTGMIGLVLTDHLYSGEPSAYELFWWVEPEARGDGVRLLRAAELEVRKRGAMTCYMISPNERVGKLYDRLGYRRIESSYMRRL